ncbi:MAG: hypothetical protein JXA89_02445 [Anaerolineae bacterium]|nr:hypothetical protein [Anaerolineae bacterium]
MIRVRQELKTLFWLQFKLTLSMFRSRHAGERIRALLFLYKLLTFVFTIPLFVAMGIGFAVASVLFLSAQATYEAAILANNLMFFMWLLLPASYSSQLIERFEMSRLFVHPIRFRSIVVGSILVSTLTMTGVWSVCILLGEVIGLAWHQPLALPLILIGALPTLATLVLTGRIMDDLFDLIAGDRRLRGLMLALMTVPFMFCWIGQVIVQNASENFTDVTLLERFVSRQELQRLGTADSPNAYLEILRPSRLLIWLPSSWPTAGMALASTGQWGRAFAFLAGSTALVAALLWLHAVVTGRLMRGAALSIGVARVRDATLRDAPLRGAGVHIGRARLRLPGSPAFWTLFHKNWRYLWRSPGPRRVLFSTSIATLAIFVPLITDPPRIMHELIPLGLGALIVTMVGMTLNMAMTSNQFGIIDREGFGTLAFSSLDRRQFILSSNLLMLLLVEVLYLPTLSVIALITGYWLVVPLGLYLGLCMQIGGSPAYNLAAIVGPYRAQLKFKGRQRGSLWGMLAWAISAAPVLALIVLPYIYWKPGWAFTLPLGLVYSVGLYALTLKPLAKLLQRREHAILQAVTAQE